MVFKKLPLVILCSGLILATATSALAADKTDDTAQPSISGDIYGKHGGYIHGYLSIAERWTDNLYYTPDDEESDSVTHVTPGIRLSLPGTKEDLLAISTATTSPGGLTFDRLVDPKNRRFQAYLAYSPDMEFYQDHTDENTVTHVANGLVRFRLRSKLTLEAYDRYTNGYEDYNIGRRSVRDDYQYNLLGLGADYNLTAKFSLRADYRNFLLDYDTAESDDRDRTDNSLSTALYYRVLSKTAVFAQFVFTDLAYDQEVAYQKDSIDQRYYGGVSWNITAKSRGQVKVGLGWRDYDDSSLASEERLIYEALIDHHFTPKTSLRLSAYRRQDESSIYSYDSVLTHYVRLGYLQKMTARIHGVLDLEYRNYQYEGDADAAGDPYDREDDIFAVIPAVRYAFNGWLSLGFEYRYEKRNSNIDYWDYTNNQVALRLTGAI
jgi:polysaccharide biosynthesis protein VpsM